MVLRYDGPGSNCLHTEQVGLIRLKEWMNDHYPGTFLGIYACRDIRLGGALSLHAEGRALDYSWTHRSPFDAAATILVDNADRLNVQAVHDYDNQRLWRPFVGWHSGNIGWGPPHEMHVERNWDGAKDSRPIDWILGGSPTPPPAPPPAPEEIDVWILTADLERGEAAQLAIPHEAKTITVRVVNNSGAPTDNKPGTWAVGYYTTSDQKNLAMWSAMPLWLNAWQMVESTLAVATTRAVGFRNDGNGRLAVTVSGT